jgi:hypothetical protein
MPTGVATIVANDRTCEFTTLFSDGSPQTWPVMPRLLDDGRLLLATSIGLPQKAFNIRRNHNVSLLFSEPTLATVGATHQHVESREEQSGSRTSLPCEAQTTGGQVGRDPRTPTPSSQQPRVTVAHRDRRRRRNGLE